MIPTTTGDVRDHADVEAAVAASRPEVFIASDEPGRIKTNTDVQLAYLGTAAA